MLHYKKKPRGHQAYFIVLLCSWHYISSRPNTLLLSVQRPPTYNTDWHQPTRNILFQNCLRLFTQEDSINNFKIADVKLFMKFFDR
jgi:hypothetical protein